MMPILTPPPKVLEFNNITVIADCTVGGMKARYLGGIIKLHKEVVYASVSFGGAQVAIAYTGKENNVKVTIFSPRGKIDHPRQLEVKAFGGNIIRASAHFLNVVQSEAKKYAAKYNAMFIPLGASYPEAVHCIAKIIKSVNIDTPKYIWCAGGSGTTARGLHLAYPNAELHCVQVGKEVDLTPSEGIVHVSNYDFNEAVPPYWTPFDTDQYFDAKAWVECQKWISENNIKDRVLFVSVMGKPRIYKPNVPVTFLNQRTANG